MTQALPSIKKTLLLVTLLVGLHTYSQAQWSAGTLAGVAHLSQRQVSESPEYVSVANVVPRQPLIMIGAYGQFVTKGKWAFLTGLQLRYQNQRHTRGNYDYLVTTPYIGMRLFEKLDLAAGPELSTLIHTSVKTMGVGVRHNPARLVMGYNAKATYWFGALGLEGGYSRQTTAFNREEFSSIANSFSFYNQYVYGALKYRFTK